MARPKSIPTLTRHASGQAVVRIDGKDHYCVPFEAPEATVNSNSIISKWLVPDVAAERTVNEVLLA